MMPMVQNSWCITEYFMLINEEDELSRPSREGMIGLEDVAAALQIYHEIFSHYLVTTAMYRQVIPWSIDHMLPPPEDDDRVIEYIQIDFEIEPEEDPEEESEYTNDEEEEEVEEDPEEEPEEEILGGDFGDDY